ncbi:MAG: type II toxin-antitoxin system VapC family toxin [Vicinamibacterales bacterium]
MVIDTSALVAILQREPERRRFIEAIEDADTRSMSVATFVEISIVIEARCGQKACATSTTSSTARPSTSWPWMSNRPPPRAGRSGASGRGAIPPD